MTYKILSIAILLVLPLFILSCDDDNGSIDSRVLTQNDFANDPNLRANLEKQTVVALLEPRETQENNTGEMSNDMFPVIYNRTIEHTFCWEDKDDTAEHFIELKDSEGNEVLTVEANGECTTALIEKGNYTVNINHDGRTETTHPIFIVPIIDEMEQALQSDGLFNRLRQAAVKVLEGIENSVIENVEAQTVSENKRTLIFTNACVGCNLEGAFFFLGWDFSGADLRGADLRRANLDSCNLSDANLADADLTRASLRGVKMLNTNLSGAVLSNAHFAYRYIINAISYPDDFDPVDFDPNDLAVLVRANLTGAKLDHAEMIGVLAEEAVLVGADLNGANLSGASFGGADFTNANLSDADLELAFFTGADFTNTNLSNSHLYDTGFACTTLHNANFTGSSITATAFIGAAWCDGCICNLESEAFDSSCGGCPSVQDVCTGSIGPCEGCPSMGELCPDSFFPFKGN